MSKVTLTMLAELSFSQEILVALIGGGLAAAGAGTAVYTQLAVSSQRRETRNHVLDEILSLENLRRCYAAAELLERSTAGFITILSDRQVEQELRTMNAGQHVSGAFNAVRAGWVQAYANKNGLTLLVPSESLVFIQANAFHGLQMVHESADYLHRASGYDTWVLRRLFNRVPIEEYSNPIVSSFTAYKARKFVERRLRTSNPASRLWAWSGDRRRCGSIHSFQQQELPAPELDEEALLEELGLKGSLHYPDDEVVDN